MILLDCAREIHTDTRHIFFALLAIIYLVLSHIFLPNLGGTILNPREYFICVAIVFIWFLAAYRVMKSGKVLLPPARVPFLLFILLSISSALFNPLLNEASFLIGAFYLLAAYLIWLSLSQFRLSKKDRDLLILMLFVSAGIEGVIGLLQLFGAYRVIPIAPLTKKASSVWGTFQQRNLLGSFLALGGVASLHLLTAGILRHRRLVWRLAFFLLVVVLCTVMVLSKSRTAWLGFTFGVILILAIRRRLYVPVKISLELWVLSVMLGIFLGIQLSGGPATYEKALLHKRSSNLQRILMLKTSWEMFKDRPLVGQGFGNFESTYMYFQAKVIGREGKYKKYVQSFTPHPHNEIAYIMARSGLLGLLGFFIVLIAFLKVLSMLGLKKSGLYLGLLSPIIVHSMVEYPLELSILHYFTFLLLLSLATSHFLEAKPLRLSQKARKAVIGASAILCLFLSGWFLTTFKDYTGMVSFVERLNSKKAFRPELIKGALHNVYLKNWAVPEFMVDKANFYLTKNVNDYAFMKHFAEWSYRERRRRPIKELFLMEPLVLMKLGQKYKSLAFMDASMKVVEEGLKIYPNYKKLKRLKGVIIAKAIKMAVGAYRGR